MCLLPTSWGPLVTPGDAGDVPAIDRGRSCKPLIWGWCGELPVHDVGCTFRQPLHLQMMSKVWNGKGRNLAGRRLANSPNHQKSGKQEEELVVGSTVWRCLCHRSCVQPYTTISHSRINFHPKSSKILKFNEDAGAEICQKRER